METTAAVQWSIYVQCGRHISSGAYTNNVKCLYTSVPDYIIDCSEFPCIWYPKVNILLHTNIHPTKCGHCGHSNLTCLAYLCVYTDSAECLLNGILQAEIYYFSEPPVGT